MNLDDEILQRIRSIVASDPKTKTSDFQVRTGQNGSVLINLRTGRAQLVYDDDSPLHDAADLQPQTTK
jgi:hypothetical protein